MPTTLFNKLAAPFDPATVSWRAGAMNKDKTKTMALAYIDARDVMNRLDEVCGPFGWQSEHVVTGDMVTCHIRIKDPDTGEWVTKSDGAGKTDVEGEKGSYSDSLKRAAVSWGIGRYLYDLATPWVEVEAVGRSYRIKDSEKPKLLRALQIANPSDGRVGKQVPAPAIGPEAPLAPRDRQEGERPSPDNSDRAIAAAAYKRIKSALRAAKTPGIVWEILDVNEHDLQFIERVGRAGYDDLLSLANARRAELAASA